jgi:hypothetical protein
LLEVDDREMIAPAREHEAASRVKRVDQRPVAVPKRKRDISTDPVENEAERTKVGAPHKRHKVS